jgi:hypothetical protein
VTKLWYSYHPCDEITGPKKISKNKKGSKFWKNFFDEKALINTVLEV